MLPPEALAELKRIRLKYRAQALAGEALLAALIHQQLYPPPPSEEVDLDRYLAGR